jgi:hypothetical protein
MSVHELEAEALKLTPSERADLAAKLLESLDRLSEEEIARVWAEEAKHRAREVDTDPSRLRPSDDVFAELDARLRWSQLDPFTNSRASSSLRRRSITSPRGQASVAASSVKWDASSSSLVLGLRRDDPSKESFAHGVSADSLIRWSIGAGPSNSLCSQ